jgi:hypothetical protein
MGMSSTVNVKQKIMVSLDSLPPEGLQEVVNFLEYMRFKFQDMSKKSTSNTWKSLKGKYKNSLSTVDEFIARKQVEKRLEL